MCFLLDLNIEIKNYLFLIGKKSEEAIVIKREEFQRGRCLWGDNPKKMTRFLMVITKIALTKKKPMKMQE